MGITSCKKITQGNKQQDPIYKIIRAILEGILERQTFAEIPPRMEYRLTPKGQELIESITDLLNWMIKWSKKLIKNYCFD
jgi:predicted transcriptional regulator